MATSGKRNDLAADVRKTSLGWIGAVVTSRGLARLILPRSERADVEAEIVSVYGPLADSPERLDPVFAELERYFAGEPTAFDLSLDLDGTPFQLAVWAALRLIPYGETRSYGDIAREIGRPRAVRAVGNAVGSNPVGIVVPCHRVIAAGGAIGGFGGGLALKRRLLAIEGLSFA